MSRGLAWTLVAAVVALGAVLRAIPCWNDFWLDEIWTYLTARTLTSPLAVFTAIHHSNNHHLNTLFFYWIGDTPHWPAYRIPSLVSGTASVALAAGFAARRGRLEAVLAAVLSAFCFALIHFSSEARGYAPLVCFSLLALWSLELDLERPRAWTAAVFGASAVLGLLSQLVFLFVYTGALVHSAQRLLRQRATVRSALGALARLHLGPLACFALLYWIDLRKLQIGAGPPPDPAWLLSRVVGFTFGLPVVRELAAPYAALGALVVGLGLRRLARAGDDLWLCFLIAILLAPLLAIATLRPEVIAVRYFLVGIAFTLLLASFELAHALRAGGTQRALALAALALFLVGNGLHTQRFFEHGRGGYLAALLTMAERTQGERIVVGSDHDFRVGSVLRFYASRLPATKTLDYRPRDRWPPGGPEWLIFHYQERPARRHDWLVLHSGARYALVAEFDHAAISGFYWALYRNLGSPPLDSAGSETPARRSSTMPKPSDPKGSAPSRATRR